MENVTTLRLPGIGWFLQWRDDGFWRDLPQIQHEDEVSGVHVPDEDEWVHWTGLSQPHARGGEWGGEATWWLIYGELPDRATPTVTLADGTSPPIRQVGKLWACEWYAVAQKATVRVGSERFDLPFFEPFYRRHLSTPETDAQGWFADEPPSP